MDGRGQATVTARSRELTRVRAILGGGAGRGAVISGASGAGASWLAREAADATTTDRVIVRGTADPEPQRRALAAWARALDGRRDAVLVVDDAHRLDAASALAVAELADRVRLVATAPLGVPLADPLERRRRAGQLEEVVLDPFDELRVAELAKGLLGGPLERRAARELHARWGGNLRHTIRQLERSATTGDLTESLGLWRLVRDWSLPPEIQAEMSTRLASLDPEELAVVETLSLAAPLGLDLLRSLSSAAAVASLDDEGWLCVERHGRRWAVSLADGGVATAVAATMPTLRAAQRADAVEAALVATGWLRETDPLARAELLARTERTPTPAELLEAARVARFALRLDLAETLARRAHASASSWEAVYLLGEVLAERGRREEADAAYLEFAPHAATDEERALVAMASATNRYYGLNRRDEAEAEVATALAALRDSEWAAELECLAAVFAMFRGEVDAAIDVARLHEHGPVPRGRLEAATVLGPALAVAGRGDEAVAVTQRAADERRALGNQYVMGDWGLHLVAMATAQLEAGRVTQARELSQLIVDASVEIGDPTGQAWGDLTLGRTLLLAGEVTAAQAVLREAVVLFTDLGFVAQLRWSQGALAMAAAHAGDATEALRALTELDQVSSHWGFMESEMHRARAWTSVVAGDLAAARDRLVEAAELAAVTGHRTVQARALHDLVRLGAPRGPAEALDALVPSIDGPMVPLLAEHRRALAAADPEALAAVASALAAAGLCTYAAEAAYQGAAELGRAGRRAAAASAVVAAAALLPGSELRTPAVLGAGGERSRLTQRELDVATLAAEGLPSKEIAARLAVSSRTVDNLLQRAYRKLGISRRADLAQWLAQGPQ